MHSEKKARIMLIILGVLLLSPLYAGGNSEAGKSDAGTGPLKVFVSILPQKYFVERIGGDRVKIEVLVGPGKSPATYGPTPQQVLELGSSDLFFSIGVPFEHAFLPVIKKELPSLAISDTASGIEKRMLEAHSHEGEEEDHHDESEDPHIWLSPRLVKQQAAAILAALTKADPAGSDVYKKGYQSFISDLDAVDAELAAVLKPYKGQAFFVFHPAFGYFGDDYGLTQIAIETGGKEPAPSVLEEIISHAKKEKVKIIFVQPEFSMAAVNSVAEAIGGAVVSLNPLNPDYLANLRHIAEEVKKALK
ncbi:MAG: zinc ABC transporter substrate-binding protein [Spirochaetales bacterium]|nr:zinc ABC transporter substrate-binding protein [Spirochaetales bacterium]